MRKSRGGGTGVTTTTFKRRYDDDQVANVREKSLCPREEDLTLKIALSFTLSFSCFIHSSHSYSSTLFFFKSTHLFIGFHTKLMER